MMLYLSGCVQEKMNGIGFMLTPNSETRRTNWPPRKGQINEIFWAADSGRYAAPEKYSDEKYLEWLAKHEPNKCLFATAPDVLGNHIETIRLSLPMFERIRHLGYKAAFVAQDGFDDAPWDLFDCLFIGGTTKFKLGDQIPAIVSRARELGKWVHMGRVNSYKRLRVAKAIGCQSADGTFLKFGRDKNIKRLSWWIKLLEDQYMMNMREASE